MKNTVSLSFTRFQNNVMCCDKVNGVFVTCFCPFYALLWVRSQRLNVVQRTQQQLSLILVKLDHISRRNCCSRTQQLKLALLADTTRRTNRGCWRLNCYHRSFGPTGQAVET